MALTVSVDKSAADLLPGSYALSVQVGPDLNDATQVQLVTLTVTAAAPQLTSSPFVVGQENNWPWDDRSTAGSLQLVEKSGKAGISTVNMSATRDTLPTGQPDTGFLVLPSEKVDLKPNESKSFSIAASGSFPLGKTTGKLELRSRELATPVVVTYEVHARRSPVWIALLTLIGAGIGLYVRTTLTKRKALFAAEVTASEVLEVIAGEVRSSDDKVYQGGLGRIRDTLLGVVRGADAAKITEASKAAQDSVIAERGKLEQRLAPIAQQLVPMHGLIDRAWDIPSRVTEAFKVLTDSVAAVEQAIARRDAVLAQDILDKGARASLLDTVNGLRVFAVDLAQYLVEFVRLAPPSSDEIVGELRTSSDAFVKAFPRFSTDLTSITSDEATTAFNDIQRMYLTAIKEAEGIGSAALSFVNWAEATLLPNVPIAAQELEPLRKETMAALDPNTLRAYVREPKVGIGEFEKQQRALRSSWLDVLLKLAPSAKPSDVRTALDRSAWVDAVVLVQKAVPLSIALGTPPAQTQSATAVVPLQASLGPTGAFPQASPGWRGFARPPSILVGSASERDRLIAKGRFTALQQSAALSVLFTVGVYVFYSETWVGTPKEMLSLFMLAFSVDLTVDSVLASFKKMNLPGA